jgi:MYXO-CTERM domain-containing protein
VRRALALLPLLALTSAPSLARAEEVLILDTWDGTVFVSDRPAGNSLGALITIGVPVTISNIAVRNDLDSSGHLKFLVLSHPDHELVYVSEPQSFADDGMSWKKSSPLDVVLEAGIYDIGAIADVDALWAYDISDAQSGDFSSTKSNPNLSNYASPGYDGTHGAADGAVRLYVRLQECGDGIVDAPEECDDGNDDNTDACLDTCVPATCGDGFTWSGHEECDDGNDDYTDACLNNCVAATCGDGITWNGQEECDDGNDDNTDACLDTCVVATCGDGYVWSGREECDDGNRDNSDHCPITCMPARCGDGYVGPGEGCDDGNDVDDDACSNECVPASCGDGVRQKGEECDDGNSKNNDGCTNACTLPTCGDAIRQEGEECDDGNSKNGDGCSRDCTLEENGTGGEGAEGGQGGTGEGGAGDGGTSEGGAGAVDDVREASGCGCRLEKRGGSEGLWAVLGIGALAVARRRKR